MILHFITLVITDDEDDEQVRNRFVINLDAAIRAGRLQDILDDLSPASQVYILTGAETESRKSPQEDFQLYTFGPETPYFPNLTLASNQEMIPLPPILANGAQEFAFEIYNSEGFGLDGDYKVYDGDRLIAIGNIGDGYSDRHVFTINGPVVEVAPTNPPTDTTNGTPDSNRTATPAPSPSSSSGGVERKAVMVFPSIAVLLLSVAFTV